MATTYGAFTDMPGRRGIMESRIGGLDCNGPDGTPSALFSYSVDGCIRQVEKRGDVYRYPVIIRELSTLREVARFSQVGAGYFDLRAVINGWRSERP